MPTSSRRALRLASATALSMLALAGLAAAGARVTSVQANTPRPLATSPNTSRPTGPPRAGLSTQTGRMTAVSAAKMIDYPVGQLRLADHAGLRIPLLLCLGIGLATCAAAAPVAARRLRRLSLAG